MNPSIYAIGENPSLYAATFNDITSGNNVGFNAGPGFDLVTGWGSPQCGLISQLASVNPATSETVFSSLELSITTGDDNLRDSSYATATLTIGGIDLPPVTMKTSDSPGWEAGTIHGLLVPLPAGITTSSIRAQRVVQKLRIDLGENPEGAETDDNWDITAVTARFISPGSQEICAVDLLGAPITRLTGSSPSLPLAVYGTFGTLASGCPDPSGLQVSSAPPTTIEMVIATGEDDARDNSEISAALYAFAGSTSPTQVYTLKTSGSSAWSSHSVHRFIATDLSQTAPLDHIVISLIEHDDAFQTDDNWDMEGLNVVTYTEATSQNCVVDLSGTPQVKLTGSSGDQPFANGQGCANK